MRWLCAFLSVAFLLAFLAGEIRVRTCHEKELTGIWLSSSRFPNSDVGACCRPTARGRVAWLHYYRNYNLPPDAIGIWEGVPFIQTNGVPRPI